MVRAGIPDEDARVELEEGVHVSVERVARGDVVAAPVDLPPVAVAALLGS